MSAWHRVGNLDDLHVLEGRVVKTESHGDLALFRTSDGQVHALEDRCPHRGGPISAGMVHGRRVTCPLHGWTLDLETGEAQGADQGCARRHPVKVENDQVYLLLES